MNNSNTTLVGLTPTHGGNSSRRVSNGGANTPLVPPPPPPLGNTNRTTNNMVNPASNVATTMAFATNRRSTANSFINRPKYDRVIRSSVSINDKKIMEKATVGCETKIAEIDFERISEESNDDSKFKDNVLVETFITKI